MARLKPEIMMLPMVIPFFLWRSSSPRSVSSSQGMRPMPVMACSTPSWSRRRAPVAAVSSGVPWGSGPPSPIARQSFGVSLPSKRGPGIEAAFIGGGDIATALATPAVCINLLREIFVVILCSLPALLRKSFRTFSSVSDGDDITPSQRWQQAFGGAGFACQVGLYKSTWQAKWC